MLDVIEEEMIQLSKELGVLHNAPQEAEKLLWKFGTAVGEPFQHEIYTCGVTDDDLMDRVKKISPQMLQYSEIRSPRDLIFFHRSLVGIYSMLCRLQHRGAYEKIRRRYAQIVIDTAAGKQEDLGWK